MPTCQEKLRSGEKCQKPAKKGKKLCRWHDPADRTWRTIYARLPNLTPNEKTDFVLHLIEEHPEGRLELPIRDGINADLSFINLSKEFLEERVKRAGHQNFPWWDSTEKCPNLHSANIQGAYIYDGNLHKANLNKANLKTVELNGGNLQGVTLINADLQDADLYGVDFKDAIFATANIQNAAFDLSNAQGANFFSANLQDAHLNEADFQDAFFVKANLQDSSLSMANFEAAIFNEANLHGANLQGAYLQDASLKHANLQGADLYQANLQDANFQSANLQGVDLSTAFSISGIYIAGARLDKTRIHREQIGEAIREEFEGDFTAAKRGYLALKQNFDDLGDYDASSWAYRKERRMEKLEAKEKAQSAFSEGRWKEAVASSIKHVSDLVVEWLCDYGESVWRVIGWIAFLLLVIGPLLFSWLGRYDWSSELLQEHAALLSPLAQLGYRYSIFLIYTLDTLTTANFSGLQPDNVVFKLSSGIFSFVGIFLAGLLGFVAGNRIRRS